MYQIALVMRETTANLSLSYKTKEKAQEVYDSLMNAEERHFKLEDDYGFKVALAAESIVYPLFIDVYESQFVTFDKNMTQDKATQEITRRLQAMEYKQATPPQPNVPRRSSIIQ